MKSHYNKGHHGMGREGMEGVHRGWAGRGHRGHCRHMRPEEGRGSPRGGRSGRRGGGRVFEHGALKWLLLSLIADKPSHGYDLIKQIEAAMGGTYAPSPGVIYPSLTLLEDMGALTVEAEGGKKLHVITDEGRRLLEENVEALTQTKARMAALSGRPERPAQIQQALEGFRSTVRGKLGQDAPLNEAQIEALVGIIDEATRRIEAL